MAPLRAYLLPTLAAVAAVRAIELAEFVPECAPPCIYEAVDTHSTCEPDDNACLCRDIYSLKRHSEDCLQDTCSETGYGESMLGYDNFCDAVENGTPEPTTSSPPDTPTTTAPPPPPETTAETTVEPAPTSETSAEEPPTPPETEVPEESQTFSIPEGEMPTVSPTDNPEWPGTQTQSEIPTSMTLPMPTVSEWPTLSTSVTTSINGTATLPTVSETDTASESVPPTTTDGSGEVPSSSESAEPTAAAGHLDASFGVLLGGFLLANFFRM